jgi:hypothetical protein
VGWASLAGEAQPAAGLSLYWVVLSPFADGLGRCAALTGVTAAAGELAVALAAGRGLSGRRCALAAVSRRGDRGGDGRGTGPRPAPAWRAWVAAVRRDPWRRGRRRGGGLAEGGRDQRVELLTQPLRVGADQFRECRVRVTGGQVHADHSPGTCSSVTRSMTDTLFI